LLHVDLLQARLEQKPSQFPIGAALPSVQNLDSARRCSKSEKRKAKSEKRKAKSEKRKAKSEKRKAKSEKRKAKSELQLYKMGKGSSSKTNCPPTQRAGGQRLYTDVCNDTA